MQTCLELGPAPRGQAPCLVPCLATSAVPLKLLPGPKTPAHRSVGMAPLRRSPRCRLPSSQEGKKRGERGRGGPPRAGGRFPAARCVLQTLPCFSLALSPPLPARLELKMAPLFLSPGPNCEEQSGSGNTAPHARGGWEGPRWRSYRNPTQGAGAGGPTQTRGCGSSARVPGAQLGLGAPFCPPLLATPGLQTERGV